MMGDHNLPAPLDEEKSADSMELFLEDYIASLIDQVVKYGNSCDYNLLMPPDNAETFMDSALNVTFTETTNSRSFYNSQKNEHTPKVKNQHDNGQNFSSLCTEIEDSKTESNPLNHKQPHLPLFSNFWPTTSEKTLLLTPSPQSTQSDQVMSLPKAKKQRVELDGALPTLPFMFNSKTLKISRSSDTISSNVNVQGDKSNYKVVVPLACETDTENELSSDVPVSNMIDASPALVLDKENSLIELNYEDKPELQVSLTDCQNPKVTEETDSSENENVSFESAIKAKRNYLKSSLAKKIKENNKSISVDIKNQSDKSSVNLGYNSLGLSINETSTCNEVGDKSLAHDENENSVSQKRNSDICTTQDLFAQESLETETDTSKILTTSPLLCCQLSSVEIFNTGSNEKGEQECCSENFEVNNLSQKSLFDEDMEAIKFNCATPVRDEQSPCININCELKSQNDANLPGQAISESGSSSSLMCSQLPQISQTKLTVVASESEQKTNSNSELQLFKITTCDAELFDEVTDLGNKASPKVNETNNLPEQKYNETEFNDRKQSSFTDTNKDAEKVENMTSSESDPYKELSKSATTLKESDSRTGMDDKHQMYSKTNGCQNITKSTMILSSVVSTFTVLQGEFQEMNSANTKCHHVNLGANASSLSTIKVHNTKDTITDIVDPVDIVYDEALQQVPTTEMEIKSEQSYPENNNEIANLQSHSTVREDRNVIHTAGYNKENDPPTFRDSWVPCLLSNTNAERDNVGVTVSNNSLSHMNEEKGQTLEDESDLPSTGPFIPSEQSQKFIENYNIFDSSESQDANKSLSISYSPISDHSETCLSVGQGKESGNSFDCQSDQNPLVIFENTSERVDEYIKSNFNSACVSDYVKLPGKESRHCLEEPKNNHPGQKNVNENSRNESTNATNKIADVDIEKNELSHVQPKNEDTDSAKVKEKLEKSTNSSFAIDLIKCSTSSEKEPNNEHMDLEMVDERNTEISKTLIRIDSESASVANNFMPVNVEDTDLSKQHMNKGDEAEVLDCAQLEADHEEQKVPTVMHSFENVEENEVSFFNVEQRELRNVQKQYKPTGEPHSSFKWSPWNIQQDVDQETLSYGPNMQAADSRPNALPCLPRLTSGRARLRLGLSKRQKVHHHLHSTDKTQ